tara:strand:+ start:2412 stop:2588 length:177 start_codon:yes stop_codon:yes gene_type:complete
MLFLTRMKPVTPSQRLFGVSMPEIYSSRLWGERGLIKLNCRKMQKKLAMSLFNDINRA